ncbi:SRPBCC family protein [Halostagnicola bangensis]
MKTVELSTELDAPLETVERELSPTSIVEYANTYAIQSVDESNSKTVLTVTGDTLQLVLEFTELDDGYRYTQVGETGPFEEMRTEITVEGDDRTRVTVRSEFTFGGTFSFIKNWLGTSIRRSELERLLTNMTDDLERSDAESR